MRTSRLPLVGVVILALLAGLSGVVLAQSETPAADTTWPKITRSVQYGDDPKQIVHVYELEPRANHGPPSSGSMAAAMSTANPTGTRTRPAGSPSTAM